MQAAVEFKRKAEATDRQLRSFISKINQQFKLAIEEGSEAGSEDESPEAILGEGGSGEQNVQNTVDEKSVASSHKPVVDTVSSQENPKTMVSERISLEGSEVEQPQVNTNRSSTTSIQKVEPVVEQQVEYKAVKVIKVQPSPVKIEQQDYVSVDGEEYIDEDVQQTVEVDDQEDEEVEEELYPLDPNQDGSFEETVPPQEMEPEQVIYITMQNYPSVIHEVNDEGSVEVIVDGPPECDTSIDESGPPVPKKRKVARKAPSSHSISSTERSGDGKFPCNRCEKSFSTKTNLNRHLASHDGRKPYTCEICQKGFTQSGSLKQHMMIHDQIRPYVCEVCDYAFTQPKSLKFHMLTHTNEKPFTCDHCGVPFRQRDSLKRHVMTRHGNLSTKDRKMFRCELCDKAFTTKFALKSHTKKHETHEGVEEEEENCGHIYETT
ncbi:zinc finger and BTB domain-containing protein 24-like isoform X2 [Uranotaenia lowii]|nr:zinc finger and BTB domain-containing protein 24-like isoform X2 [Uranotaenia lowii]